MSQVCNVIDLQWQYLTRSLGEQKVLDILSHLPGRRAPTPKLVAQYAGIVLPEDRAQLAQALEAQKTQSASASRAMTGYTQEQREAIAYTGPFLAINAFAGAGKTTTLRGIAQKNQNKRILYLAFNREMSESARRAMPKHVRVATVHSYALDALGWGKSKKLTTVLKPLHVKRAYETGKFAPLFARRPYRTAKTMLDALESYAQQAVFDDVASFAAQFFAADEMYDLAVSMLCDLWQRATDPNDLFPTTHDVYLKYWQLSRPKINADILLLDEAQDVSAPMYSVFVAQDHARRILVGDRHQAIYDFRGAINAMRYAEEEDGADTLYLTQTFRFGSEIANLANLVLSVFKEEPKRIQTDKTDQVFPAESVVAQLPRTPDRSFCVITRTNARLFEIAYDLARAGVRFAFAGNLESYPFFKAQDVFFLALGQKSAIVDRFIAEFDSFDEYKAYANESKDIEEMMLCAFVEKYGKEGIRMISEIQAKNDPNAAVTLTTAHKSKGSEWDEVYLGDDFVSLFDAKNRLAQLSEAEANLLYVAITRARHVLYANDDCIRLAEMPRR